MASRLTCGSGRISVTLTLTPARAGYSVDARQREANGGAAPGTFEVEPWSAGHPFLTLNNTFITPHVGYVTGDA